MRDHSHHVEIGRDQAIELLLEHASFNPSIETIPLEQAAGRVLAQDVVSAISVPNTRSCRMDSVAVHWDDFKEGMPDTTGWQQGKQWNFANTGIAMPEGFDTAVVIENVVLSDDLSSISFVAAPSRQFAGTSEAGSKIAKGDVLAKAGQVLTPLLLSGIAAGNVCEVQVLSKPSVAFIPTGNELVNRGGEIPLTKNIETNSILVAGKIAEWGGETLIWDIVPDNTELIKEAVAQACAQADIVVLNAGSSKGSDDWNVEMLDEMGTILYHQTNHGPGHHSSGAVVNGTAVVGISGPPGGVSFTTDFYVYPLIMKYLGQPCRMKTIKARLAEAIVPGGPGHSPKPKDKAPAGEDRPSVVAPGGLFFGVRQVRLEVDEDGVMEAYPAKGMHLNPVEANETDGYYLVSSRDPLPQPGDFIAVDVRPR